MFWCTAWCHPTRGLVFTAIYRWSHGPNWHPPPVATLSLSCAATTTCLVLQLVCFQIYAQYHARIRSHRHPSRAVSTFQYYACYISRTFKSSFYYLGYLALSNFMYEQQKAEYCVSTAHSTGFIRQLLWIVPCEFEMKGPCAPSAIVASRTVSWAVTGRWQKLPWADNFLPPLD